jgi:hypothetical protein
VIFAKRIRKKDFSRVAAPVCRATAQAGGRCTPKKNGVRLAIVRFSIEMKGNRKLRIALLQA